MRKKTKIEYKVIASDDLGGLSKETTKAVNDGWELVGGISAFFVPEGSIWKDGVYFLQSAVRRKNGP